MTFDAKAGASVTPPAPPARPDRTAEPHAARLLIVVGDAPGPVCPDEQVVLRSGPFWSGYRLEWIRVADSGIRADASLPAHRLAFVQHGTCDVTYRALGHQARQRLSPGTFCFASRGFTFEHLAWKSRGLELVLVDIADLRGDPNPIDAYGRTDALFDMAMGIEDPRTAALVDLMCGEVAAGCPTGRVYAEALSLALASRVASLCASMPGSRRRAPILSAQHLQRVNLHIARHIAEDLTIERLAAAVNISPFHFARCFKQATGMSPHKYVTRERILRAREMIADGRHSIGQIALSLGFASQSHFADVYRRTTGNSPRHDKKRTG